MAPRLSGLILAAGLSSRMGALKALLPLDGQTVLARCVALLRECGVEDVVVVTGHRADEVGAAAVAAKARVVLNPDYAAGMYGSIWVGAAALAGRCDGFFLLPVDIPLVRRGTVRLLAKAFADSPESLCYPVFSGRRGHPPLLPAALIGAILRRQNCPGGLRALLAEIEAHSPELVREVEVADANIHIDLDTPEDFLAGSLRFERRGQPTMAECEAILTHLHPMVSKGMAHGRAVAEVAATIAAAVNRHAQRRLDVELCRVGGWLHDVAKGHRQHEEEGARWLRDLGFDRVADIVAAHKDLAWTPGMAIGEREIVHLADKLIRGSRLVAVRDRFEEKLTLYGDDPEAVRAIGRRYCQALALADAVEAAMGQPLTVLAEMAERPCNA